MKLDNRKDQEHLAELFKLSHQADKTSRFLERVFDVVVLFLQSRGYEIVSPELRIAEARMLSLGLHTEYFKALNDVVRMPQSKDIAERAIFLVIASPEEREQAVMRVLGGTK